MSGPFGYTGDDDSAPVPSKERLKRHIKQGEFQGLSEEDVRSRLKGGKKKKKKKLSSSIKKKADSILKAREKQRPASRARMEEEQSQRERERIAKDAIAVVLVPEEDRARFTDVLAAGTEALRNFMLTELAANQLAVTAALDQTTQELNLLLEGGVSVSALGAFERLNTELAMIAMAERLCEFYKIPKDTRRKIIAAKVEFLRPKDRANGAAPIQRERPMSKTRSAG